MNRTVSRLVLALFLTFSAGCSSPKPPTAAAVQGNSVIATLKDLSSFYGKKNAPGFLGLIDDKFKDREAFAGAIRSVFSGYDAVQFTVQYTRMFIAIDEKGVPRATFNWESAWEKAGGSILKNSGRGTFVFDAKSGKLSAIEGRDPFLPQAIETPKQ